MNTLTQMASPNWASFSAFGACICATTTGGLLGTGAGFTTQAGAYQLNGVGAQTGFWGNGLGMGAIAYAIFFATFVYAVGFVGNLVVPKSIDIGLPGSALGESMAMSLFIDVLLLGNFAVQHSVMARPAFKRWWTRVIPASIERSTFVIAASAILLALFWQWRPMPHVLWHIADTSFAMAVTGVSMVGWVLVFTSTFLINHFELFGLQQVVNNLNGRTVPPPRFRTPLLYKVVRHPIYLGFMVAFWVAPTMTVGHLMFAAVTTAYIFVGIALEERDLVELFGDEYRRYRQRVAMIVPFRRGKSATPAEGRRLDTRSA
mgnify:CR=1 FL=1